MNEIKNTVAAIRQRAGDCRPKVAIVLGSGLGPFADAVADAVIIHYGDLPGFPTAGVAGHAGRLVLGRVGAVDVAVMQGRAHYYEHGTADVMRLPLEVLKALGCDTLLLTNAAGSLLPEAGPGAVVMLTDHINFTGVSPLFGETDNARFVDLSEAYDPAIRAAWQGHADKLGIRLHEGVYMWFCGPNFETPAEIRAAKVLGADAVGMSTVPEVIIGRRLGLRVAALSIITNMAAGMSETALSHEQTMANADAAARDVQHILTAYLEEYE